MEAGGERDRLTRFIGVIMGGERFLLEVGGGGEKTRRERAGLELRCRGLPPRLRASVVLLELLLL